MSRRLAILVICVLLLAACGGGEPDEGGDAAPTDGGVALAPSATAPDATAPPEDSAATPSEQGEQDPQPAEPDPEPEPEPEGEPPGGAAARSADGRLEGGFGADAVESDGFGAMDGEVARLRDVRVASHDGTDRVVLEFEGDDLPGYRVAEADEPIRADGSGEEVEVDGGWFLEIRVAPASGPGPERVDGDDTVMVNEAVRTGDFEATVSYVVGVEQQMPFAVTTLTDPLRLVVDIQQP